MASVVVSIVLPYRLSLVDGEYLTPAAPGRGAVILRGVSTGQTELRTQASSTFKADDTQTEDEIDRQNEKEAELLLARVNHLLRWYRVISSNADVLELGREAGTFDFIDEKSGLYRGFSLEYLRQSMVGTPRTDSEITALVIAGLSGKAEPDVGELNILDARHALDTGRFRESVLLAWSAIDATFAQAYERVISPLLDGEYADGRDFLLGFEIPMKTRMTAMLYLANKRSLFRELGKDDWKRLVDSYNDRNAVIHRGESVPQAHAERAISVALQVVAIAKSL